MSVMVVILVMAGLVFVYSAVKGKDPREVIKDALKRGQ